MMLSRLLVVLAFAAPLAPSLPAAADQLLPVGQHNEYSTAFRRWNVSTNPVGWVLGSYGLSVSYGPHPNLALRADVNYFRPLDSGVQGYELGLGLPIYLRRTYLGPFLEPGIIVRHFEYDGAEDTGYASTVFGPQVLVGWHWTWDSGLNVAVALGLGRDWSTRGGDSDYDDEELFVNGYLRFGYAF